MKTEDKIRHQLATHPIILYMKGIPSNPQCGFSGKAVATLNETKIQFAYVNVLEAPFIREKLPSISHWPTYPQLFVNGELVGGCDIIEDMHNKGTLVPLLMSALVAEETADTQALSTADIKKLLNTALTDAEIFIDGQGCDLTITAISGQFSELTEVKRQQLMLSTLTEPLASGRLHAVSLKTFTPEEWQEKQSVQESGLLQIQIQI